VTNPRLRINLVALLCTFSIFSINCTVCGQERKERRKKEGKKLKYLSDTD
jgi:hypothetical protein